MSKLASLPITLLCLAFSFLLLFIFYGAPIPNPVFSKQPQRPLRDYIEDKLYDIRTRMQPATGDLEKVKIVNIDTSTIRALEAPEAADLRLSTLIQITKMIAQSQAQSISVFLYPNVFSYDDPDLAGLVALGRAEPRLRIAVMGIDTQYPSPRKLPANLVPLADQTFGLETFRPRMHSVIRNLPFVAYRGIELRPLLISELANLNTINKSTTDSFHLNYTSPAKIKMLNAKYFHPKAFQSDLLNELKDKHVFLGYTLFRERPINNEQIFANTPWQEDNSEPQEGAPLLVIQAIGLENLLQYSWLKPIPFWLNVISVMVISGLSSAVWLAGVGMGLILLVGWWVFLFYCHALIFSLLNVYVPLSDALIFSWLATIAGALWTLRYESIQRLNQEAKADALLEVEKLQSRFLSKFAEDLNHLNEKIFALFKKYDLEQLRQAYSRKMFLKLLNSYEELHDYLYGIKNFASMTVQRKKSLNITPVNIKTMVEKILNQFEAKITEANLKIELNCPANLSLKTDATILEPIIFNLISNAIKYSPDDGSVTIKGALSNPHTITISVQDNGPGIDPEFHRSIFEKFYRVKDDLVYKIKGNGLGLYLCKFFAERIHAQISLDSAKGQGSTFFLKLKTSI